MSPALEAGVAKLLAVVFAVTSLSGLAALLRSGKPITWAAAASTMLYSGLIGTAIFAMLYSRFEEDIPLLIGVSILAGLGGGSLLDFMKAVFQAGGVNFHVQVDRDPPKPEDSHEHRHD